MNANGAEEARRPAASPRLPLEWKFSQVFGERTAGEEVQEGAVFMLSIHSRSAQFRRPCGS